MSRSTLSSSTTTTAETASCGSSSGPRNGRGTMNGSVRPSTTMEVNNNVGQSSDGSSRHSSMVLTNTHNNNRLRPSDKLIPPPPQPSSMVLNGTLNGGSRSISLVQDCSAIKKGLMWEQQQNRFFFNRWKERFFILTTDYLTCFKKGSKKVGMSEMGSFVYKVSE